MFTGLKASITTDVAGNSTFGSMFTGLKASITTDVAGNSTFGSMCDAELFVMPSTKSKKHLTSKS